MNWNSVGDFVAMGGYGLYVWGSVMVTAASLAIEVGALQARRRAVLQRQTRRLRLQRKDKS